MTISEQLREAALYLRDPVVDMTTDAFCIAYAYRTWPQQMSNLQDTARRTFLLIVAEALE